MGERKKARLTITGKVQGVFFRDFAKQNANKLSLGGYVKNKKDGSVEIEVEGDELNLNKFLKLCKTGPMMAKVDDVKVEWLKIDPEDEITYFDIRYL